MVQHVKVIVTKSDDLGLILRNHMVEEKNKYLHIVFFFSLCMLVMGTH